MSQTWKILSLGFMSQNKSFLTTTFIETIRRADVVSFLSECYMLDSFFLNFQILNYARESLQNAFIL